MAEKMTPEGLVVGLIPEENKKPDPIPVKDEEKTRRGRKPAE